MSATITRTIKSANATNKKTATPINTQKRDKLKDLLITKFMKKLNVNLNDYSIVAKEVSAFMQKEKLNDNDLKLLEEKIVKVLRDKDIKQTQKEEPIKIEENDNKSVMNNNYMNDRSDAMSIRSNTSELSRKFPNKGVNYSEINSFELRKLLQNEKKPLERYNFDKDGDEWTAILKHKNEAHQQYLKEQKLKDIEAKRKVRETFNDQIKEKEEIKNFGMKTEQTFHKVLLSNVDQLTQREIEQMKQTKEKKLKEKELRDLQIQDNVSRKVDEFSKNRQYDTKLINNIHTNMQQDKEKDRRRKIEAKEGLKRVLQENDENKKKQLEQLMKEREDDIKSMEEYTRILDKQEQDRANYFKNCENRQKNCMNRMADTVVKQQDEQLKLEEEKQRKYQEEKNKRDDHEDDRRKKYIKDTKSHMREYLTNQMYEKKKNTEVEKMVLNEQVDMWKKENSYHFNKDKETNDRVKQINKLYAEYLKSQMNKNRNGKYEKMNEEEYRLNREILDEIKNSPGSTVKSNKKFLF